MRHRILTPLFLLTFCFVLTGCAVPKLAWVAVPDVASIWGVTVDKTLEGGYLIGGGYHGGYDMFAYKLDAAGHSTWSSIYSNPTPDSNQTELWRHEARGALQTADGGNILLGAGNFFQDILPDKSYLLVKTDNAGTVAWAKAYAPDNPYDPGKYCCCNEPGALQITSDGGYVAFGSSYVGQYNLASILKTDAAGNVQFLKVINDNAKAYDQIIVAGQQTADGGYILSGYSENSPHGYMALLIKLDANGDLEWSKTYQDEADGYGATAYAVVQTSDGGYVMGGTLVNNITKVLNHGCWMSKVNANGDAVWFKNYGYGQTIGRPNAIAETPQGDLVAAGANATGKPALAKFNAGGGVIWNFSDESLPSGAGNALTLTDDGGCVMVASGNTGGNTAVIKVNNVYAVK